MVRRTYKGRIKFEREPPPISARERSVLAAIDRGYTGQAAVRRKLYGKGLITSPVGSKASLTALGRRALASRSCPRTVHANSLEAEPLSERGKWLAKYAASHPKGGWG